MGGAAAEKDARVHALGREEREDEQELQRAHFFLPARGVASRCADLKGENHLETWILLDKVAAPGRTAVVWLVVVVVY